MRGDRMTRLVDGDRAGLVGHVVDVDRRAGLDRGHRLDDVLPAECFPPGVVCDRQRHRADLLDHRRRVAHRHARKLVAATVGVEVRLVRDAAEVELEDVLAVVLRRRPEPDVASHAARPRQRRVELIDRNVGRPDEVDLLVARLHYWHLAAA